MKSARIRRQTLVEVLPIEFIAGLHFWAEVPRPGKPLTKAWNESWGKIAAMPSIFTAGEIMYPGSIKYYRKFENKDGFHFLKRLSDTGVDANFILSLFVPYLWNKEVSATEHRSPLIRDMKERLDAVGKVRRHYMAYFKGAFEKMQKATDSNEKHRIQWSIDTIGGRPRRGFEEVIDEMEAKTRKALESMDYPEPRKGRLATDKVNRVIFTIYQHIVYRTNQPQWETFWNLLVSAGAIRGGGAMGAKDRQIRPHIDSFQRDHPKEARMIIERIIPGF